jgi:peptide chain release factor
VVAKVVECLIQEAQDRGLETDVLEFIPGDESKTLKSALLAVEGDAVSDFVKEWEGTIQWIGKSQFRSHHKRQNWFVGVTALKPLESREYSEKDFRVDTMRASGAGGQHVNKTESAVRITHVPTGLSATAREERSQHLNKKLALTRLAALIREKDESAQQTNQQERWDQHNVLERGNPIRTYVGEEFKLRR